MMLTARALRTTASRLGPRAFFSSGGGATAEAVEKLLDRMDVDKIKFLRLQFSDLVGHPKNVAIPATQAYNALKDGIGFDGSSIQGFVRIEESDMILKPDPSTYSLLPWRAKEKVARFICDVHGSNGLPFQGDPRYVLKRVIEEAKSLGYECNFGPEMEFFLFKMIDGKPTTEFLDSAGYFDLGPTLASNVRRDIVLALTEMGFDIEASHHEVAQSQHEIDFRFCDALRAADNVITFKYATKAIALENGLHATFMAKPVEGINGSGMHVNCSLFKDGQNAFYDLNSPQQLSDTARHFIGGILKHVKGITRLANPTINSYKRLVPGYEAPVYISWSAANRSALCRVPAVRGKATRVEFRSPDPSCNPYLTFASVLAAGLDGIRNQIEPPECINGNIFDMEGIDTLPGDLKSANDELLKDKLLCDALGTHVVENLTRIADAEWDGFRTAVHPWEVDRYLANY
jgi:glutamine synthetase